MNCFRLKNRRRRRMRTRLADDGWDCRRHPLDLKLQRNSGGGVWGRGGVVGVDGELHVWDSRCGSP